MKPREERMTSDECYMRLVKLLSEDTQEERNNMLARLRNEILGSDLCLSREQALDIRERATELFRAGECGPLLFLVPGVVALAEAIAPESGFWTPPVTEGTLDKEYRIIGHEARVLRDIGILSPDERILAADIYRADIVDRFSGRLSRAYLTDKRLLLAGPVVPVPDFVDEVYRLYYDDWESRPCVGFMDTIWLDKIRSVEPKWSVSEKAIIIRYHAKYMKEKQWLSIGPHRFRTRMSVTSSVNEMEIPVYLSPLSIIPEITARRMAQFVEMIHDAMTDKQTGCATSEAQVLALRMLRDMETLDGSKWTAAVDELAARILGMTGVRRVKGTSNEWYTRNYERDGAGPENDED